MSSNQGDPPVKPVQLPKRATSVPQLSTARQRSDGTIEPEGPGRISESEVVQPRQWWNAFPFGSLGKETDRRLEILKGSGLEGPDVNRLARTLVLGKAFGSRESAEVWLLVHGPQVDLRRVAQSLSTVLFEDSEGYLVVDASEPKNRAEALMGEVPGYSGHLDGGLIANQLARRPASVIVVSNWEYADRSTLITFYLLDRNGKALMISQGGRIADMGTDAVFILATTLGARHQWPEGDRTALIEQVFRQARPELDWDYLIGVLRFPLIVRS